MRKTLHLVIFSFLLLFCYLLADVIFIKHKNSSVLSIPSFSQMPPSFVGTFSLEFKGLIADYIFLHVLTFMGEKVIQEQETTRDEWEKISQALETVIELDPRATDPYILATTTLPWEAGMVSEANRILLKVAEFQTEDYRPHFFLWYNYFHHLNDFEQAAYHLKKAAAIPGSPTYLKPLASRMHLYSGHIEGSIAYTMEVIETTNDTTMQQYMMKRLDALKKISFLEEKIRKFKNRFGSLPNHLEELISVGIIPAIPEDPYGGRFIIQENGRVYSTSKLVDIKKANLNPE